MTKLDIDHALYFLDKLDPGEGSRHTIASEAPFGRNGLPKWEGGATYNRNQRKYLIADIIERQERKSNVYYSVNRPCKAAEREGSYGKNNIDDITQIRALAFDIDTLEPQEEVLKTIRIKLYDDLQPSLVIFTGGGYHLIYLFDNLINTYLYRPAKTDNEKKINDAIVHNRSSVSALARDFEHYLRGLFGSWKVDNMSNVDRVMRLPGTINYPKAEKVAKGQKEAESRIIFDSDQKSNLDKLRIQIPISTQSQPRSERQPFVPSGETSWTGYLKAKECCDFIKEKGLADTNEWYTINVMLPLIGAIHDENEHNRVTIEEAQELFMHAISGGERYNSAGRGERYFLRQWKSHHPELKRNGTKSLGGLIWAAKENGMEIPWKDEPDEYMKEQIEKIQMDGKTITDDDLIKIMSNYYP